MREEKLHGDVRYEAERVLIVEQHEVRAPVPRRSTELSPELELADRRLDLHVPGGDDVRSVVGARRQRVVCGS